MLDLNVRPKELCVFLFAFLPSCHLSERTMSKAAH